MSRPKKNLTDAGNALADAGIEIAEPEPTLDALEILRALNAGRVTISTPDFLEWIADRLDLIEGRHFGDTMGGMDYCIRLRTLAAALRKATSKWERE